MDEVALGKLQSAVESLVKQGSFLAVVDRLEDELHRSNEPFVWSTIALRSIPSDLPSVIRSCWIFRLKEGVPSDCHYHPNSVQHMVVLSGQGTAEVDGRRRTMVPFASPNHTVTEKWFVIEEGVPHEFTPEREDMTVVSFHTCELDELQEISCGSGESRLYERPDV